MTIDQELLVEGRNEQHDEDKEFVAEAELPMQQGTRHDNSSIVDGNLQGTTQAVPSERGDEGTSSPVASGQSNQSKRGADLNANDVKDTFEFDAGIKEEDRSQRLNQTSPIINWKCAVGSRMFGTCVQSNGTGVNIESMMAKVGDATVNRHSGLDDLVLASGTSSVDKKSIDHCVVASVLAKRKGKLQELGDNKKLKHEETNEILDDIHSSRLLSEIERYTVWDSRGIHSKFKGSAISHSSGATTSEYDDWIVFRDSRLSVNKKRKEKFIVPSMEFEHLIAKDDVSITIVMMHKRELMYPIFYGLKRHPELNSFCRAVVIDWLVEVNRDYNFSDSTLHTTIRILDIFLYRIDKAISRNQLQLVGVTAVLISSKFFEPALNLTPKECAWVTDKTYTEDEVKLMERLILSTLGYQVYYPTPLSFLHLYNEKLTGYIDNRISMIINEDSQNEGDIEKKRNVNANPESLESEKSLECLEDVDGNCNIKNEVYEREMHRLTSLNFANYAIDNALLYAECSQFPSSLQAATALALSRCLPIKAMTSTTDNTSANLQETTSSLKSWSYVMDADIEEISGYDTELSLECAKFLLLALASSKGPLLGTQNQLVSTPLQAVQRKYQQLDNNVGTFNDMLRTRNRNYNRSGSGSGASTNDLAAIARDIVINEGWCFESLTN